MFVVGGHNQNNNNIKSLCGCVYVFLNVLKSVPNMTAENVNKCCYYIAAAF